MNVASGTIALPESSVSTASAICLGENFDLRAGRDCSGSSDTAMLLRVIEASPWKLKLAHIQKINQRLYRAYLLKEQLRQIYRVDPDEATGVLEAWLKWAQRCRLAPFIKLARTIRDQRAGIQAAFRHGLSNARVEQINTQIRLITRRGFSYHSQQAVIALAMLSLAGLCPPLPGR